MDFCNFYKNSFHWVWKELLAYCISRHESEALNQNGQKFGSKEKGGEIQNQQEIFF